MDNPFSFGATFNWHKQLFKKFLVSVIIIIIIIIIIVIIVIIIIIIIIIIIKGLDNGFSIEQATNCYK